jgi:hypothetical protein
VEKRKLLPNTLANTGTAPAILSTGQISLETTPDCPPTARSPMTSVIHRHPLCPLTSRCHSLSHVTTHSGVGAFYHKTSVAHRPPENRTALRKMGHGGFFGLGVFVVRFLLLPRSPRLLRYRDQSAAYTLRAEPLQNALRTQLHQRLQSTLPHRVACGSKSPTSTPRAPPSAAPPRASFLTARTTTCYPCCKTRSRAPSSSLATRLTLRATLPRAGRPGAVARSSP